MISVYITHLPKLGTRVYITHLPKLETRVRLIWGDEAFKETNSTHSYLFLIYDAYAATVSTLITKSYARVSTSFTTFFLSLIAGKKKPPHNKRLSPVGHAVTHLPEAL